MKKLLQEDELVSVIIPVYNNEKYIRDCLDSVVAQTYPKLEVIVIDDGSTDRTGEICNEFAEKYHHITVIHTEKIGVSAARNIGLNNMHGRWVVFVDGDDYIHSNMVEVLYKAVIENQVQFVRCGFVKTHLDKALIHWDSIQQAGETEVRNVSASEEYEDILKNIKGPFIWAAIYDRDILKGVRFTENYVYEDILFIAEILARVKEVCRIGRIHYAYRINPASITHKPVSEEKRDLCTMVHKRADLTRKAFPLLYGLATGQAWAVTINVYNECLAQKNNKVAELLLQDVRNTYLKNIISWKGILENKMPMVDRILLIGCKISFKATCKIKKLLIQMIELRYTLIRENAYK